MFDDSATIEELEAVKRMLERALTQRKAAAGIKRRRGRPRVMEAPKALGIILPQALYDRVAAAAKSRGVSKTSLAREALSALLPADKAS